MPPQRPPPKPEPKDSLVEAVLRVIALFAMVAGAALVLYTCGTMDRS